LSGPDRTIWAEGIHTGYPDVDAARQALRAGLTPIVLGALPFDIDAPAALMRPRAHRVDSGRPRWPVGPLPPVHVAADVPSPDLHQARIGAALATLRDPASGLKKVVLARALDLLIDAPLPVPTVLGRLAAADPEGYTYFADLTPAGGEYVSAGLFGASPELLVARRGDQVVCRPFAGSAPRSTDPEEDRANSAALAHSAKNLHEHAFVVDAMIAALEPLCVDLEVPATPQLSRTGALWHLCTPIVGRLRDASTNALELALALHPTPAVGGVPAAKAAALIAELEGDRGFYAGATGWCDSRGDGMWVVSIRCAQLSADGRRARAYSGGGIVAESDVADELAETSTKFATILSALGAAL